MIDFTSILELIITVFCSVMASSGFWAWRSRQSERKDAKTKLLIGLAHDRIISLGESYIERGWISVDEFENLHDYLYKPYAEAGGNGSAERVMNECSRLRISTWEQERNNDE